MQTADVFSLLKESHPLETAEYAEANLLLWEPVFSWWVPQALRQKHGMVKVLKTRYHRMEEKFGIELPKNVKQALELDKETGTDFWKNTLIKEVGNLEPCILVVQEVKVPPPGYTKIRTHIVFDIKMDFTRKA